jgi:hypothetical protein
LNGAAESGEGEEATPQPKGKRAKKKTGAEQIELFDLARDPYEKSNVASANPARVTELRARYDALAKQAVPPKNAPPPPGFQSPKVWGEE